MNRTLVPIAAVCMLTFYLVLAALSPDDRPGGMDVWEFANLPIRHEGRIKPMDTVARLLL